MTNSRTLMTILRHILKQNLTTTS